MRQVRFGSTNMNQDNAPKNGPRLIYVRAVAETEATFAVDRVQAYVEMGYQATKKALG